MLVLLRGASRYDSESPQLSILYYMPAFVNSFLGFYRSFRLNQDSQDLGIQGNLNQDFQDLRIFRIKDRHAYWHWNQNIDLQSTEG